MSATTFFVSLPVVDGSHVFDFDVFDGPFDTGSLVVSFRLYYTMTDGNMSGTSATMKTHNSSSYAPNSLLPLDYFQAPKLDWGDSMSFTAYPFFKIYLKDGYFAKNFKFNSSAIDFSMFKKLNCFDGRVVSSSGSSSTPSSSSVDASGFFANVDYSLDGNYCKYIDGQYVACADQGIFIVESSRLVSSGTDTLTPVYRLRQDISFDSAVTKHRFIEAPQNHLTSVVFDSATAGV